MRCGVSLYDDLQFFFAFGVTMILKGMILEGRWSLSCPIRVARSWLRARAVSISLLDVHPGTKSPMQTAKAESLHLSLNMNWNRVDASIDVPGHDLPHVPQDNEMRLLRGTGEASSHHAVLIVQYIGSIMQHFSSHGFMLDIDAHHQAGHPSGWP